MAVEAPVRPGQDAGPVSAQHAKRWYVLAILGIAQLMVVLDSTVVNIALPDAQKDLGFSASDRQWIITAYSLAFGSLLLIGGRISDLFGRKRVFLIGIAGFAIASAVGGASVDFGMLAASRAVQGAFGALLAPAALSLLTTTFTEPSERGKAFGIYGGIAGTGASVGLLLGGALTEYLDWRWVMYVNVIFAVVAFIGGSTLLAHQDPEENPHIDLPGTLLVCISLFSIVFGFSHAANKGGSAGWTDPVTVVFLVLGVVLMAAFVMVEKRAAHPLLPLRVVVDRNRGGAYTAMFMASVGMFGVFLFLTYYLQATLGYSAIKCGLAFLPLTLFVLIVATLGQTVLATRISPKLMVPSGMVLGAIGMALLTRIGGESHYATQVLPGILFIAGGLGLVFAPSFNLGTFGVGAEDAGVASATVNVCQQVGGAVGTALLNTIVTSAALSYSKSHAASGLSRAQITLDSTLHSYHVAFWIGAVIFLIAGLLVAPLLRPGIPDMSGDHVGVGV